MRACRQRRCRLAVVTTLLMWWLSTSMLLCDVAAALGPTDSLVPVPTAQITARNGEDLHHHPAPDQAAVSPEQASAAKCRTIPCHTLEVDAGADSCCADADQQANVGNTPDFKLSILNLISHSWVIALIESVPDAVVPLSLSGFLFSYTPPPIFLWVCAFLK